MPGRVGQAARPARQGRGKVGGLGCSRHHAPNSRLLSSKFGESRPSPAGYPRLCSHCLASFCKRLRLVLYDDDSIVQDNNDPAWAVQSRSAGLLPLIPTPLINQVVGCLNSPTTHLCTYHDRLCISIPPLPLQHDRNDLYSSRLKHTGDATRHSYRTPGEDHPRIMVLRARQTRTY